MNKNQKLVEKFLAGNLAGTGTFELFTSENEEGIKRAEVKRDNDKEFLEKIQANQEIMFYDYSDPEDVFLATKNCLQESLEWRKQSYTQACSIVIESGVLRCQVPVEGKNCGSHASIKVAERNFFFIEKSFSIPEEFMGKNPLECEGFADWVIKTMIMHGNFLVWVILQDELNNQ